MALVWPSVAYECVSLGCTTGALVKTKPSLLMTMPEAHPLPGNDMSTTLGITAAHCAGSNGHKLTLLLVSSAGLWLLMSAAAPAAECML